MAKLNYTSTKIIVNCWMTRNIFNLNNVICMNIFVLFLTKIKCYDDYIVSSYEIINTSDLKEIYQQDKRKLYFQSKIEDLFILFLSNKSLNDRIEFMNDTFLRIEGINDICYRYIPTNSKLTSTIQNLIKLFSGDLLKDKIYSHFTENKISLDSFITFITADIISRFKTNELPLILKFYKIYHIYEYVKYKSMGSMEYYSIMDILPYKNIELEALMHEKLYYNKDPKNMIHLLLIDMKLYYINLLKENLEARDFDCDVIRNNLFKSFDILVKYGSQALGKDPKINIQVNIIIADADSLCRWFGTDENVNLAIKIFKKIETFYNMFNKYFGENTYDIFLENYKMISTKLGEDIYALLHDYYSNKIAIWTEKEKICDAKIVNLPSLKKSKKTTIKKVKKTKIGNVLTSNKFTEIRNSEETSFNNTHIEQNPEIIDSSNSVETDKLEEEINDICDDCNDFILVERKLSSRPRHDKKSFNAFHVKKKEDNRINVFLPKKRNEKLNSSILSENKKESEIYLKETKIMLNKSAIYVRNISNVESATDKTSLDNSDDNKTHKEKIRKNYSDIIKVGTDYINTFENDKDKDFEINDIQQKEVLKQKVKPDSHKEKSVKKTIAEIKPNEDEDLGILVENGEFSKEEKLKPSSCEKNICDQKYKINSETTKVEKSFKNEDKTIAYQKGSKGFDEVQNYIDNVKINTTRNESRIDVIEFDNKMQYDGKILADKETNTETIVVHNKETITENTTFTLVTRCNKGVNTEIQSSNLEEHKEKTISVFSENHGVSHDIQHRSNSSERVLYYEALCYHNNTCPNCHTVNLITIFDEFKLANYMQSRVYIRDVIGYLCRNQLCFHSNSIIRPNRFLVYSQNGN